MDGQKEEQMDERTWDEHYIPLGMYAGGIIIPLIPSYLEH